MAGIAHFRAASQIPAVRLRLHLAGDYAYRQPLAYPHIRMLVEDRLHFVDRLEAADIVIVAHPKDIAAHGADLATRMAPDQKLVLLSEEPFWDTIWGDDPRVRNPVANTEAGPLPYTWLNHRTSKIFEFERIPYFLLTDRRYFNRYALRFARNAKRSAAEWRAHFETLEDVVFMAEKRRNPKFDRALPDGTVFGLAALRTRIALACSGPHIRRVGHGWQKARRRQALDDWHLEKLSTLDACCRILSAIENTHDPRYVTEKIFDAFAIGALPLYIAGPGHRVHDIVPGESFLNLHDKTPEMAAEAVLSVRIDAERIEAFRAAQTALADLFGPGPALAAERARLGRSLAEELLGIAQMPAGSTIVPG